MQNAPVSNPNDTRVVSFRNSEEFGFTPEMGCMYDGRAINGNGGPGIQIGETMVLPYHVGRQLALNLAKIAINRTAPNVDPAGIPTGVPLWDDQRLNRLRDSYLTDLYSEEKPATVSETDKLMAKVEEYKKMVDVLLAKGPQVPEPPQVEVPKDITVEPKVVTKNPLVYQDKQEVIAELEKRGITFDRRLNKEKLEKMIV